ncbi:hypothetical protein BKI51_02480 [Alphaproteobacteria bacterium AO1-B]|nr:hypothetical protein BKI51_02480 [Alphaproteobacteria bacterium AO1-B]
MTFTNDADGANLRERDAQNKEFEDCNNSQYTSDEEVILPEGEFKIKEIQKRNKFIQEITSRLSELDTESLSSEWRRICVDHDIDPIELLSEEELLAEPKLLWKQRDKSRKLNPAQFILEVYGSRLGKGFTRAHIKALDRSLYEILAQWLRQNEMPNEVYLPSKSDWYDVLVQALDDGREIKNLSEGAKSKLGIAYHRRN